MKKVILALALLTAIPAFAQQYRHYPHHRPVGGWWVAPVIGGVVAYEVIKSQQQVVVQQQPIVIQQPPVVYQPNPNCGPWVETQNADGTITRTRTCNQ